VTRSKGKVFFTGIVRDLTHTKALQEQIVQSERLAALGQTVAEISHEIRNPMVVIGGFVRQLIKKTEDPRALEKLEIMASEVRRVESLLTELRDLYLPRPLKRKTFDLGRMLQEVHALARQAGRGKRIRWMLETGSEPVFARGDRERLKQVFFNLVKNAVEAVGEDGEVAIRSTIRGDRIVVTIRDDGPGILQEFVDRVFTPFFTTKREGTGLGLCISKRILDEHKDCSLKLTSERGRGTIVEIGMPRRSPPGRGARSGKGVRAHGRSRGTG
jgi:signal transduction histidine kinase